MRRSECRDDLLLELGRIHRLEPILGHALLATATPDGWVRAFPAEERPRPGRVPRAALVLADPAGTGFEHRRPHRIQRLLRNEHDELAVHVSLVRTRGTGAAW